MDMNSIQALAIEFAIVVLGLLLGYKCIHLKKDKMNLFMRFIVVLNAFGMINIPIRMTELHLITWNRSLVFIMYAISVTLMTFTMAYWFLFNLRQIDSKLVNTKVKVQICYLPAICIIPLCIANYWTGWLYTIDDSSIYSRGSIFILQAIISYVYFFVSIISNIVHMVTGKEKVAAKKCFMSSVPAIIGAALQIIYSGSFLLLGIIIGAWVFYIDICLDRQMAYEVSEAVSAVNDELKHSNKEIAKNMKTILALSDIYHTLYEVDLSNDTFTEIKAKEEVSEFCSRFQSARACMKEIPEALFAARYVEIMKILFDPESMYEYLKNTNSYFMDAVAKYSNDWIRTTIIVSERDANGDVTHVVLTFQEIGEIIEQQSKLEEAKLYEIHAKEMKELFVQTAHALAGAIDAKDRYTHGHSRRVAEYSRKIAKMAGMEDAESEKVYFAALLHDVGKIGIADAILRKAGKLTDEEFDAIKQHPVLGYNILKGISQTPYLSIGAHYHHERYDGKGYPEGLKGEDIPEIARIIAVADAYDAMTSNRSYRTPLAQQRVREELVKGMGTQFDPKFALVMVHLVDKDTEYKMKDDVHKYDEILEEYSFDEYKIRCTEGVQVTDHIVRMSFAYDKLEAEADCIPSIVVYDSLDSRVYVDANDQKKMEYTDFCDISFNGNVTQGQIRDCQVLETSYSDNKDIEENKVIIEAVRQTDHILIKLILAESTREYTIAMQDRSQFAYIAVTGKKCLIHNFNVYESKDPVEDGYIKRIAKEISYIEGKEEGDLENLEIAGWREKHSDGVLIDNEIDISFHAMSLPASKRLWHCPIAVLFTSENGKIYGPGYREFALVRFDGESWEADEAAKNELTVTFDENFSNWDEWKKESSQGVDCKIYVERSESKVLLSVTDGGVHMENITTISEAIPKLYCALTGDQVAIMAIHINR